MRTLTWAPARFSSLMAVIVSASALLDASPARADDPTTPDPTEQTRSEPIPASVAKAPPADSGEPRRWYGAPTLVMDLSSLALLSLGMGLSASRTEATGSTGNMLLGLGLMGYGVAGPIVHLAHGHPGRAAGDLAVRLTLPLASAFVGGLIGGVAGAHCTGDWCGLGYVLVGAVVGTGLGGAGAIAIDGLVFSYERVPTKAESLSPSAKGLELSLVPRVSFVKGAKGNSPVFGLAGTF